MEWEIKPFGKESSFSGNPFIDGEEVHCLLIRNKEGVLVREDLQDKDIKELDTNSVVMARWKRVFEQAPDTRRENLKQQRTLEDLFFSLFELEDAVQRDEADTLKQIIGLMLERKRVIRRLSAKSNVDAIVYLHVKSRREFFVPVLEITPKVIMGVQEKLQLLIS